MSRTLGSMIDAFTQAVSRNFRNDAAVRERAVRYHENILNAIAIGDAETAYSEMQSHLQDVVHVAGEIR